MKKKRLLLLMFPLLLSVQFKAQSCTSLAILDMNNNLYHGRTLELTTDLPSWITYYPENTIFQKKMPDGKDGVRYQSHYKILAISTKVYDDSDIYNIFQGMNSGGLSFSANMINNADLDDLKPNEYKDSLPVTAIGEWALSQFSSVSEVKESVGKIKFRSPVIKGFGNIKAPLHYAFYDKNGGSIVVEVVNGKLEVYDNPTRVMTNGPDFPWHLKNLNNYTQLTNIDRSRSTLGNMSVSQPDSGIAISALPSSDTSVGRFIRGVFYTTYAQKPENSQLAMNTLAHIMNRFDRVKGITVDEGNVQGEVKTPQTEYTVWTSLSDLKEGKMLVKGYVDINYTEFSFEKFKENNAPFFERINVAQ